VDTTTPQNLSQNPGFETGESPWLQWWDSSVATNHFARNDRGPHTGTYKADHWDPNGAALAQYTYQVVTGVPNGLYTLRAWVRSSGGLQQLYLGAKNFGGTEMRVSLPVAAPISTYTLYQLNHIPVTAGKIEVYFWTKAPAGQWLWSTWDDLVLVKE
jgi:arabinogalactan endo-1,4-beta-galactosidase